MLGHRARGGTWPSILCLTRNWTPGPLQSSWPGGALSPSGCEGLTHGLAETLCLSPSLTTPAHSTLGLETTKRVQGSQAKILRGRIKERDSPEQRSCPKKGQEELGSDAKPLLCTQGFWACPAVGEGTLTRSGFVLAPIQPPDPA